MASEPIHVSDEPNHPWYVSRGIIWSFELHYGRPYSKKEITAELAVYRMASLLGGEADIRNGWVVKK